MLKKNGETRIRIHNPDLSEWNREELSIHDYLKNKYGEEINKLLNIPFYAPAKFSKGGTYPDDDIDVTLHIVPQDDNSYKWEVYPHKTREYDLLVSTNGRTSEDIADSKTCRVFIIGLRKDSILFNRGIKKQCRDILGFKDDIEIEIINRTVVRDIVTREDALEVLRSADAAIYFDGLDFHGTFSYDKAEKWLDMNIAVGMGFFVDKDTSREVSEYTEIKVLMLNVNCRDDEHIQKLFGIKEVFPNINYLGTDKVRCSNDNCLLNPAIDWLYSPDGGFDEEKEFAAQFKDELIERSKIADAVYYVNEIGECTLIPKNEVKENISKNYHKYAQAALGKNKTYN